MNMDEKTEEKTEDKKPEETTANSDVGVSSKEEKTVVDDAKTIVKEMKEANKKKEELLDREEKLQAKKETLAALGGGSEAGQQKVVETEDEKWAKDAKERYAGTGMSPLPDEQ